MTPTPLQLWVCYLITWSFVDFMGGKRHHCCGNKQEILKEEINCVVFYEFFFWKSMSSSQFVYTKTRRKQPMPDNYYWLKIFHYFLKRIVTTILSSQTLIHINSLYAKFSSFRYIQSIIHVVMKPFKNLWTHALVVVLNYYTQITSL